MRDLRSLITIKIIAIATDKNKSLDQKKPYESVLQVIKGSSYLCGLITIVAIVLRRESQNLLIQELRILDVSYLKTWRVSRSI